MAKACFQVRGLTYFHDEKNPSPILRDASFRIPEGRITTVVGLSGSGKTTILHLLGLLAERESGEGIIEYRSGGTRVNYARLRPADRARLRLDHFGFVLQDAYMLPHFRCLDNIAMPLALRGIAEQARLAEARRLLDVADPSGRLAGRSLDPARRVSGGERQRMAVLRAVIHDPRVVFADEPISNLDHRNSRLILKLFQLWLRGELSPPETRDRPRTLVLVTHNLTVAHRLGHRFVALREGRVVHGRTLTRADVPTVKDLRKCIDPEHASLESPS